MLTSSSPLSSPSSAAEKKGRGRLVHRRHGVAETATESAASTTKDGAAQEEETAEEMAKRVALDATINTTAGTLPAASPVPVSSTANASDVVFEDAEEEEEEVRTTAAEGRDGGSPAPSSSAGGVGAAAAPPQLFSCDTCLHICTSSAALQQHALDRHGELLGDYCRLKAVADKLPPLWDQVFHRKRDVVWRWGRHIFAVAAQRDAGVEKMAEAHRARAQLEVVVRRWHPNARVYIFGSSVAFGVWDGISDIDFTVVDVDELEHGTWPPSEKNAVRTITELLRRAGFSFINLEPISHARVPIIKHHASSAIRLTDEQRHRLQQEAEAAVTATGASSSSPVRSTSTAETPHQQCEGTSTATAKEEPVAAAAAARGPMQLEAESIMSRSVRYAMNLPASRGDAAVMEASIRHAVGSHAIQQVWWNRSREQCCMTFETTTHAMKGATCPLAFKTAGMRARVQPLHDECRPELYNMDFDLSFRAFGIRNSLLLRRYLLSHPCARPGALVLKDWSKASGVNNSMNGYLTSYAVNILWIYYLVHQGLIPYVDPIFDIPSSLRANKEVDPQYAAMIDPEWSPEQQAQLELQAGELLLGFFYYYAFVFDWERHVVSLNRPGVTTKASIGWDMEDVSPSSAMGSVGGSHLHHHGPDTDATSGGSSGAAAVRRHRATTRYAFCIEDPYEDNLNLGRHMGVVKAMRVQTEFYRGLLSLLKGDYTSCVFGAASRHEMKEGHSTSTAAREEGGGKVNTASLLGESNGEQGRRAIDGKQLPVRVLYRLLAICTREMAVARHERAAANSPFGGVELEALMAAMKTQAPLEWKLASGAWNSQQILHRLGFKICDQMVLPRREVGLRRSVASPPPPGVVPASAAAAAALSSSVEVDNSAAQQCVSSETAFSSAHDITAANRKYLQTIQPRGLSEDLLLALTRGYQHLTPPWVAWSRPWAALAMWWGRTDSLPKPVEPSSSPVDLQQPVSGSPSSTAGAFRPTRKQLMAMMQRGSRCCQPSQRLGLLRCVSKALFR